MRPVAPRDEAAQLGQLRLAIPSERDKVKKEQLQKQLKAYEKRLQARAPCLTARPLARPPT